jgi:hypothetical protein
LERVEPRDVSELRELVKRVGLEWAIDFANVVPVGDPDLAGLVDFNAAAPAGDPEPANQFELEAAVSSRHPLEALSKTASFRTGDWQSVFDVIFRFARAKSSRWRETSHALKEILVEFPESTKCLESQSTYSVGEQLLWLSIDGFDRGSVAGCLDPRRPSFALAWREFHGRVNNPLMADLANDDVEGLRMHLLASEQPNFNQFLRVDATGGDIFESATDYGEHRELSILAVAAQFGAVSCARFLLVSGATVGASEVEGAFLGGNVELMRRVWEAFPRANPLEVAVKAVKSWNLSGLRWLLDHKIGTLSHCDLVRLLRGAISSGSYLCASFVLGSGESATSHFRDLRAFGEVGPALCRRLESLRLGRAVSLFAGDSMAAEYSEELAEWVPEATVARLIAKREGHDAASVNAFVDAAKGRTKTLTFVETENSGSICGGYLDVAWAEGCVNGPGMKSFIFTLKNHLGVPPTRFAQTRIEYAAYMRRNGSFYFGCVEGFVVWHDLTSLTSGQTYEAPRQGVTLIHGSTAGIFRAARWELWQVR